MTRPAPRPRAVPPASRAGRSRSARARQCLADYPSGFGPYLPARLTTLPAFASQRQPRNRKRASLSSPTTPSDHRDASGQRKGVQAGPINQNYVGSRAQTSETPPSKGDPTSFEMPEAGAVKVRPRRGSVSAPWATGDRWPRAPLAFFGRSLRALGRVGEGPGRTWPRSVQRVPRPVSAKPRRANRL